MGPIFFFLFIQEFILGGLIIYHSFTLSQKNLTIIKSWHLKKNQWKVVTYTGCQNNFMFQHPAHFLPFLKAPADKLRQHSQISFKSWLNNMGSELRFSFKSNAMVT